LQCTKQIKLPRGGLQRIVSNQFYSQVFGITPPTSGHLSSKSEWLKLLQQQDKDNPGMVDSPVAANATADLGTAATQSNANIHWLYQLCQKAKVSMMTDVLLLGISLVVL
jgi:hypothetical protein